MLTGLFEGASIGPPLNLHKRILLVKVYKFWTALRLKIVAHINFLFSCKSSRV